MKSSVRVIAGKMKGRVVPFVNSRFGNADITPQKIKGAIFSILGGELDGLVFLDLYSGSGQIGIEAISRGCSLAVLNEFDRKRYSFIADFLSSSCSREEYIALNMTAFSALKYIHARSIIPDIVFLDPPYEKNDGGGEIYSILLERLSQPGMSADDAVVVVQHFKKNILPEEAGRFKKKFTRTYGISSLSLYEGSGTLL